MPKIEYYIEWWQAGGNVNNYSSGKFKHSSIVEFLMTFLETRKYNLLFLRRESDGEVIFSKRDRLEVQ
jgi:predicted ATPase